LFRQDLEIAIHGFLLSVRLDYSIYNIPGHKLRFPQSKTAQFPGTARQGRCVTVRGMTRTEHQQYHASFT
jgi:hypothetical protein